MTKEKFDIEYGFGKVSLNSLWNQLTTPNGLAAWFAEKVTVTNRTLYTFRWDKDMQQARVVLLKPDERIRYRWEDETDPVAYFEFSIHRLELSGTTALQITDFAEPGEKQDAIDLWDHQVDTLRRSLGI